MRVYTVHLRRHGLIPDEDLVFVREGFSWWAFLFTFVWALWHRMWWMAVWLFIGVTAISLAAEALLGQGGAALAASMAVAAGIGFVADELRRRQLRAEGYAEAGLVAAEDEDAALHRFLQAEPYLAADMAAAVRSGASA